MKYFILFFVSLLVSCAQSDQQVLVRNEHASIGASIGVDKNGWLHLINLTKGGPAEKSKAILHGDRLVGIKTSPETQEFAMVHKLKREEVISLIQGEQGSKVRLWLVRDFKSYYVSLVRE